MEPRTTVPLSTRMKRVLATSAVTVPACFMDNGELHLRTMSDASGVALGATASGTGIVPGSKVTAIGPIVAVPFQADLTIGSHTAINCDPYPPLHAGMNLLGNAAPDVGPNTLDALLGAGSIFMSAAAIATQRTGMIAWANGPWASWITLDNATTATTSASVTFETAGAGALFFRLGKVRRDPDLFVSRAQLLVEECNFDDYPAGGYPVTLTRGEVKNGQVPTTSSAIIRAGVVTAVTVNTAYYWWLDDGTNVVLAQSFSEPIPFTRPGQSYGFVVNDSYPPGEPLTLVFQ